MIPKCKNGLENIHDQGLIGFIQQTKITHLYSVSQIFRTYKCSNTHAAKEEENVE